MTDTGDRWQDFDLLLDRVLDGVQTEAEPGN